LDVRGIIIGSFRGFPFHAADDPAANPARDFGTVSVARYSPPCSEHQSGFHLVTLIGDSTVADSGQLPVLVSVDLHPDFDPFGGFHDFIGRQQIRQPRTSRWWTTAICGFLKFLGITHFVSSLGSCVGGATAIGVLVRFHRLETTGFLNAKIPSSAARPTTSSSAAAISFSHISTGARLISMLTNIGSAR